jgi:hypothetical protein
MGALGLIGGQGPQPANIAFACFSIPFWLIGFGMVASGLWMARGRKFVFLSPTEMVTQARCLIWKRTRNIALDKVQHARHYSPSVHSNNQTETFGAEVVYVNGSFVLPADTEAEEEWLIGEVNDYLEKNRPAAALP